MLRVLIIEDDRRYRASLLTMIAHAPGLEVAGCYGGLDRAEEALGGSAADVAIVHAAVAPDLRARLRRLGARTGQIPIVVTHLSDDPATVFQARAAGADGYLPRSASRAEILAVLRGLGVWEGVT